MVEEELTQAEKRMLEMRAILMAESKLNNDAKRRAHYATKTIRKNGR
jgi:hypothetical protein